MISFFSNIQLTGLADEMSSLFCEVKRLEVEHLKNNPKDLKEKEQKSLLKVLPHKKGKIDTGNTPGDCLNSVLNE